jgi:hypothetical protein
MAEKKLISRVSYPSIHAMRDAALVPFKNAANNKRATAILTGKDERWYSDLSEWYGVNMKAAEVIKLTLSGHEDGADTLRAFRDSFAAKLPRAIGVSRKRRTGDSGDALDIHAVYRGATDRAWSSSVRALRAGNTTLRLYIDLCANAGTDAAALRWRGLAGASLAEIMKRAGYSVEIVGVMATDGAIYNSAGNDGTAVVSCVIVPRGSSVNLQTLASTVCLPGFFRTLGFLGIIRCADRIGHRVTTGLGHYASPEQYLDTDPRVTTLFVPGNIGSENTARAWIEQSITLLQGATK